MNFMQEDEFLLLMANCEGRWVGGEHEYILTTADRARLYDIGIRTAHEQPAWCMVEPNRGNYNFGYLDNIVFRNREAGLKTLMQLSGWRLPPWIPNDWRARQKNGTYEVEVLSMWNDEAQAYADHYIFNVLNHYKFDEDVGFFYGEFQGGEGIYPASWPLYDHAALESYRDTFGTSAQPKPDDPDTLAWFGRRCFDHFNLKNALLSQKHREVWNCQQRLMDTWSKAFGNFVQETILKSWRVAFPEPKDLCLVLCQCTYYDSSHDAANSAYVHHLTDAYHMDTIVEAMFCAGLPYTTPKAIAEGFRGQIVHPACEPGKTLEEWEINNMRDSHNLWMRHYENTSDLF